MIVVSSTKGRGLLSEDNPERYICKTEGLPDLVDQESLVGEVNRLWLTEKKYEGGRFYGHLCYIADTVCSVLIAGRRI